jgi:outer membrane protein OmpA-like peptidoglycan-associated protein
MRSGESGQHLASSMTDLMTSLAIIFILLLVVYLRNVHVAGAKAVEDVNSVLDELLKMEGIEVKKDDRDPRTLLIIVPGDVLTFELDKDQLSDEGKNFLSKFTPKLSDAISKIQDKLENLVIEGHTDKLGTDEHNLELSQKRSLKVMQYSLQVISDQQRKEQFLNLTSVSGRGCQESKCKPTDSDEERRKDRKVVYKVRVKGGQEVIVEKARGM